MMYSAQDTFWNADRDMPSLADREPLTDADHAGFVLERSADRVGAVTPHLRNLGDRIVTFDANCFSRIHTQWTGKNI